MVKMNAEASLFMVFFLLLWAIDLCEMCKKNAQEKIRSCEKCFIGPIQRRGVPSR